MPRPARAPSALTIRTYQVGFGDCFLLSFRYGPDTERHVLIDFGSTALPKGTPKDRMMAIARDIAERCKGKLHAVVATHRHKDHISGFDTRAGGNGTGDIIRALEPDVVVQPWTEDPKLARDATGPRSTQPAAARHVAALSSMHAIARQALRESQRSRHFGAALKAQLAFLGEDNIANPGAVRNLMTMAKRNHYVWSGSASGLEAVLPGVTISVLGPPTLKQTKTIRKQRSRDADEFWHLQAKALTLAATGNAAAEPFPRHVRSRGPVFPIDARWLIHHARATRGDQLLQIVRMLDQQMNNTSLILTFQVGRKSLLFPGDAQIENWQYALEQPKYRKLLAGVDLYKVGHHGSLNATPKTLWSRFDKRSKTPSKNRMKSLLSTMEHKHGSEASNTEVPRRKLLGALKAETDLFSTQELKGDAFYRDVTLTLPS